MIFGEEKSYLGRPAIPTLLGLVNGLGLLEHPNTSKHVSVLDVIGFTRSFPFGPFLGDMLNFSDAFIPRFPSIGAVESFDSDGSPGKERPKKKLPRNHEWLGHVSFSAKVSPEAARKAWEWYHMQTLFIMKHPMWKWVCCVFNEIPCDYKVLHMENGCFHVSKHFWKAI